MSSIIPFNKTIIQTAVRFTIDISILVLNTSATFRVTTWDSENKIIEFINVTLDGQDYANWSNNDDYVVEFIAQKLGFRRN